LKYLREVDNDLYLSGIQFIGLIL